MTGSSTDIVSVSFAYPDVDGATRAELARCLRPAPDGEPVFVLSTCLRTEVVTVGDVTSIRPLLDTMFGDTDATGTGKIREGADAVEHLYRVAAGLESPILGEREILTQFRAAVIAAGEAGNLTGTFSKLIELAVGAGRAAREVLPESPHDSMAAIAAQVVGSHDRVAVLGSGTMATALAKALAGLPAPPTITVVARSPERVTLDGVDVWSFDRAPEALSEFDAVISATSAKKHLVADDALERAIADRKTQLTLVDMAMPPDFDIDPSLPIRYVDIDDLARMADRRSRGAAADEIVHRAAVDAHRTFVEHDDVGPVIGALVRSADDVVDSVVERFGGRLTDPADIAVLRQTAHTVARTLLAGPISYLRGGDRPSEATDVVSDAFGIDA